MIKEQKIGELPEWQKKLFKQARELDKETTKIIKNHFNSGGTLLGLRQLMDWCHYSDDTIRLLARSYLNDLKKP